MKRENKKNIVISAKELRGIISSALIDIVAEHPVLILSDSHYTCIPKSTMTSIYKKSDLKNKAYKPEKFDCDDFSVEMKSIVDNAARIDSKIISPYAHGIVYGNIPTPHAINWFVTPDKELFFFEPQRGAWFKPTGNNIMFIYT